MINVDLNSSINCFEEFTRVMAKYQIDKSSVCLLSSCSLAVRGVKKNSDIEFALNPEIRNILLEKYSDELQINPYSNVIKFTDKIECDYNLYSALGINDQKLFTDINSEMWNGYRVVIPAVYVAQLILQNREKDNNYINLIQNTELWSSTFRKRVKYLLDIAKENGFEMPSVNRDMIWNQIFKKSRNIYIFGTGHIGKHVYYRVIRDGLTDKLSGFVVSKRQSISERFFDKPVKTIIEILDEDPIIIVAVAINNMIDTVRMLHCSGINNMVQGFQFWISDWRK